ncbi:MAG: hypothetical protein K2J15_01780, partial [Muribaculaceae bacterium]|nr:hypothetical protein [Muribaculaceae bacterium]
YYVGLHITSTRAQSSVGVFVSDFTVKSLEGANAAVPGKLTDVTIVPGEFGEPYATATVVLPTKDVLDRDLPKDDEITLTMAYYDDGGQPQGVDVTGKPGETVTIKQDAPQDGFVIYTLSTQNKNGKGYSQSYSVYVGIDTPLCPVNIAGVPTDNNLGMHLTWDSPGIVGENGGYVDLEAPDFYYTIYTRDGISLHKIDDTKELEYTFYPYGEAAKGTLATFNVGPVTSNVVGQSTGSMLVRDDLGTPYELPMKDEFNTAKFSYSPYTYSTSGVYSMSTWENSSSLYALGMTDVIPNEGVLLSYSEAGPCKTKMNLPKFTTAGLKKTIVVLRYLDYASAPKSIQLYGRSSKNNEETFVGEVALKNPIKGEWVDAEISLPENLNDCSWV